MGFKDICNTDLVLGLGYNGRIENRLNSDLQSQKPCFKFDHHLLSPSPTMPITSLEPSLTLGRFDETYEAAGKIHLSKEYKENIDAQRKAFHASVKREKDLVFEEVDVEKVSSSKVSDEDEEGNTRKKLRLTKQQSALLEDNFKEQSTLNPKRKQFLAKKLNLRPRQVEVWFQNRRARTKLKQTEEDCEFLKKYYEALTEDNRRLKKELQELKEAPLYMPIPAATLTMCPSCERVDAGVSHDQDSSNNHTYSITPKPHFFSPFTHPSATC